ncbi:hypothetical protein [Streptomyces sp. L7]|uniref:hypothetical protein n=1 Tax=Streptomyces sp. L7 TaxID=3423954 RepID=UPI003D9675A7
MDTVTVPRHRGRTARLHARAIIAIATVAAFVCAGAIVAAAGPAGAPAQAATGSSCGMATTAGTGIYASSLCWLDMSGYNSVQATSAAGEPMTETLPGGYTATFTLNVSGQSVAPSPLPTYGAAYLGNGAYAGVPGQPALYQPQGPANNPAGNQTVVTISNVTVTDRFGHAVSNFSLISADAESTDYPVAVAYPESISWTATTPLSSIQALGNACGGGFTGAGTTTVTCTGGGIGSLQTKTGTPVVAATNPATLQATLQASTSRQAVAFGFLFENITLTKQVVGGTPGDSFTVSVSDGAGNVLGSATTGGASSATTGSVFLIGNVAGSSFTMKETAAAGSLIDYAQSWSCTSTPSATGVQPTLPAGGAGASATVSLLPGQSVSCTLTNTALTAGVTLTKRWVGALTGSTAALTIGGPAVTGAVSSTSTAGTGPNPDTANVATATANLGSTVTLAEAMGGTAATYAASYACTQAGTGWTATGATFTMPSAAGAVNCVVSNATTGQTVQVDKTWIVKNPNGTVVGTYNIPAQGTDTAPTPPAGFSAAPTLTGQAAPSFGGTYGGYVVGQAVSVGETSVTVPPGCTLTSAALTAVNGAALGTPAALPYPGTLTATPAPNTFTITNTVACTQTLTLVKKVAFGSVAPTAWTLTATGPSGALPGPNGTTGAAAATNVGVTPGVAYALGEASNAPGAQNYVPTAAGWACVAGGTSVTVSGGAVTVAYGQAVTCTITNTTATITLLKHIQSPGGGLTAGEFTLTVTPPAALGGATSFAGSETPTTADTIEVKPGASYTLSEQALSSTTAYLALGLQQSTDGGTTWTPVSGNQVTASPGTQQLYRFVNQAVPAIALPLTGGLGTDVIGFSALGLLAAAAVLLAAQTLRRARARRS